MFKSDAHKTEELDRVGKLLLKSATASEADTEAAASSPFLLTRVRAAIVEERRNEDSRGWLSLIQIAWRAVPAMALIAILAGALTVWTTPVATPVAQTDDEPLIGALEPGVEQTVLASRNGLTREDVFNIVVERNYEANSK
ncbi:MAG TPA: hypothetical protein VE863_14450 [Pyrinomonadaceae bacterium]|jgi:hypothetical protein|nr:hypothetical protein [Pyrinomonadaceae bacterium]